MNHNIEVSDKNEKNATSLAGQMLVAMPSIDGGGFNRSLILMFEHSEKGAMGVAVNHVSNTPCEELIKQLEVEKILIDTSSIEIHSGGPVETGRGFVIHSDDYQQKSTSTICEGVAVTATIDIVQDILSGNGPKKFLLVLGYAGWGPSQLDDELRKNAWLYAPVDKEILFDTQVQHKWSLTLERLGVESPDEMSYDAGDA